MFELIGQRSQQDKLCRICGNQGGPNTQQIKSLDKWVYELNLLPFSIITF